MRVSLVASLVLLIAQSPSALEIDEFELNSRVTYRFGTDADESVAAELELRPRLDLELSDTVSAVVSARLRGDAYDLYMPGEPAQWSYSQASRPVPLGQYGVAELRDAYAQWRGESALIRLGKQQIVWGSLDGIKVLDVLNPQSFEYFILEDFDQSRIPLWSAYVDLTARSWRLETALIVDDTSHYIPVDDAWMAFQAPRFRFGLEPGLAAQAVREIGPEGRRGTLALRASRALGATDIELVAVSGRDHEPVARSVIGSSGPEVEVLTTRRDLMGFSVETSMGQAVLRLEGAFSPDRSITSMRGESLELSEHDNWRAALGIDLNAPLGLFVNAQYLHDELLDPVDSLTRPTRERTVTLAMRRGFAYDTVQAAFQLYYGVEFDDQLRRFSIDYAMGDRMSLGLAVDQFRGDARGPFGQFVGRDQFAITWTLAL